jgi:hypothetical protein
MLICDVGDDQQIHSAPGHFGAYARQSRFIFVKLEGERDHEGTFRSEFKLTIQQAGCPMTLERSRSPWMEIRTQVEPLVKGADGEVVIVGAGIAGLSAAYELARAGKQVLVVDRAGVGAGMTGRTTAHLAWALDDYYYRLVKLRGKEAAAAHARHHSRAIDRIDEIRSLAEARAASRTALADATIGGTLEERVKAALRSLLRE